MCRSVCLTAGWQDAEAQEIDELVGREADGEGHDLYQSFKKRLDQVEKKLKLTQKQEAWITVSIPSGESVEQVQQGYCRRHGIQQLEEVRFSVTTVQLSGDNGEKIDQKEQMLKNSELDQERDIILASQRLSSRRVAGD